MKKILAVMMILCLSACTTRYTNNDIIPISKKVNEGEKIYIVLSPDGAHAENVYPNTGIIATSRLSQCLSERFSEIIISQFPESEDEALNKAKKNNARYVFLPILTNWEPRNAVWSGRPTRFSMKIAVYDVDMNNPIMIKNISSKGRSVTLFSQSVEDIMDGALKDFCKSIF